MKEGQKHTIAKALVGFAIIIRSAAVDDYVSKIEKMMRYYPCFQQLIAKPDAVARIHRALESLSMDSYSAVCDAPENLELVQDRGFVVLRGAIKNSEMTQIALEESCWGGDSEDPEGSTQFSDVAAGGPKVWRRSFDLSPPDEQQCSAIPVVASAVARIVNSTRSKLRLPDAYQPVSGEFFNMEPCPNTEIANPKLHGPQLFDWHEDPDIMFWTMLEKVPSHRNHANLDVLPIGLPSHLANVAMDFTCDSKNEKEEEEEEELDERRVRKFMRALFKGFERFMCHLHLVPGDCVLLQSGIFHRTSDYLAKRVAATFDLNQDLESLKSDDVTYIPEADFKKLVLLDEAPQAPLEEDIMALLSAEHWSALPDSEPMIAIEAVQKKSQMRSAFETGYCSPREFVAKIMKSQHAIGLDFPEMSLGELREKGTNGKVDKENKEVEL